MNGQSLLGLHDTPNSPKHDVTPVSPSWEVRLQASIAAPPFLAPVRGDPAGSGSVADLGALPPQDPSRSALWGVASPIPGGHGPWGHPCFRGQARRTGRRLQGAGWAGASSQPTAQGGPRGRSARTVSSPPAGAGKPDPKASSPAATAPVAGRAEFDALWRGVSQFQAKPSHGLVIQHHQTSRKATRREQVRRAENIERWTKCQESEDGCRKAARSH